METCLVSISHKQCRNRVLRRNDWVQLGLFFISRSSDEQSVFIYCSLWAAVEASWIVHVLFIPPLLLLASRWILGMSPWAICSPVAGEREGEGEEKEGLGAIASQSAEQMLSGAQEAGAWYQGVGGGWVWPSVCVHICVAPLALSPVVWPKALPAASPIELLGLGREQAGISIFMSPCSRYGCIGNPEDTETSLGTVLFSLQPACHGDLLVHLCTGAEKGRTQTAQMEQCSIYLLSYFPPSQSQDLESLSSH